MTPRFLVVAIVLSSLMTPGLFAQEKASPSGGLSIIYVGTAIGPELPGNDELTTALIYTRLGTRIMAGAAPYYVGVFL